MVWLLRLGEIGSCKLWCFEVGYGSRGEGGIIRYERDGSGQAVTVSWVKDRYSMYRCGCRGTGVAVMLAMVRWGCRGRVQRIGESWGVVGNDLKGGDINEFRQK